MKPIRIYTQLARTDRILGLELYDWGLLLTIYALVFIFSVNLLVNLIALALVYIGLKLYKHKKPAKYSESLVRFVTKPGFRTVKKEE